MQKDINQALQDHEDSLLDVPGVVGVYIGVLPDGVTPCIKVMAVKKTDDLSRMIPSSIEGFPVLLEETGIIHPFSSK